MISPNVRLRLEDIAARIAGGVEVSFEEITFIQKWADHNQSAAEILRKARRRAINGEPTTGTVDELLDGMNLGNPDPQDHLIGPQTPDDLARWFHRDRTDDWTQHD